MDLEKTSVQEWIQRRVAAVRENYTAFQCISERGIEVPDDSTPYQIPCPFHGADNRPSARYYPKSGGKSDYVRCFKCRENWDSINLYSKFNGKRFMDALQDLERRFRIKIPQRPEAPEITEPAERGANYVSNQWQDVPRMMTLLEGKLLRVREKSSLTDYIRFCRVLDAVQWDFDKIGKSVPSMAAALQKLMKRIDEVLALPDDLSFIISMEPIPPTIPDEYLLKLSNGELIEVSELDAERSPALQNTEIVLAVSGLISQCSKIPRTIVEEAKKGYDQNFVRLFKGDPRGAMIKANPPGCGQHRQCAMESALCTLRAGPMIKKLGLPMCWEYAAPKVPDELELQS